MTPSYDKLVRRLRAGSDLTLKGEVTQMCATVGRSLLSHRDSISVEVRSMYGDLGYDPVVLMYGT